MVRKGSIAGTQMYITWHFQSKTVWLHERCMLKNWFETKVNFTVSILGKVCSADRVHLKIVWSGEEYGGLSTSQPRTRNC